MEMENVEIIWLELKYCERCGGLWIRPRGAEEVYCPACAPEVSELPVGRRRPRPPMLLSDSGTIDDEWKEFFGICGEGGNA